MEILDSMLILESDPLIFPVCPKNIPFQPFSLLSSYTKDKTLQENEKKLSLLI